MTPADRYEATGSGLSRGALLAYAIAIFAFILAPIIVITVGSLASTLYLSFPPQNLSLRWYHELGQESRWAIAAWNTLKIGVPVALISVVLGTLVALGMVRSRSRAIEVLGIGFIAPMMLPHIIIAIGLYPTIVDLGLANTYLAVVIGHVVVSAPFVVLTVTASLRDYPETLEMAAMTLGANRWRTFWRVTFPMIRHGIGVGGLFAFATSFDELMLSLFLTGPETETLPRLIWEHLFYTLTPVVAAASTFILAFSIALILLAVFIRQGAVKSTEVSGGARKS
ncbi:ABC transporter permease [Caballeronia cordobensis]|uniref:ABC transporter permease n=1 Tax=Caballeronia cordobensis TaxID=1353886 RepID=UPI00045F0450|nr:putative membrane protein [Burkholderia sp. RPE67]